MLKYKIVNGTSYKQDTPDEIVEILENARANDMRLVLDYGDIKTGKSWNERYNISGYVGRSCGAIQIPLLIYNSRASGGASLLDNCIVKISLSKGKKVLWQHANYSN